MEKTSCDRCNRQAKGLYTCSICKMAVCSKCFLDNLTMCRNCLTRRG
ncbi:MAG: orotate phosphoribosyltransferase [Candidatus Aenigmarchaeota archaeon]|nr:orotate phosphoribosyltransferase [Candidatus Aenigmarchaeota archaeon]